MKKYELTELLKRWERDELTVEQAVGQIMLWINTLSEQITKLDAKQRKLSDSQSAKG